MLYGRCYFSEQKNAELRIISGNESNYFGIIHRFLFFSKSLTKTIIF